jgi:hypothetical protein
LRGRQDHLVTGQFDQQGREYGGVKVSPGSVAEAAPAAATRAPKLRITAAAIRAIVFNFIEVLRSDRWRPWMRAGSR